jgi:PAS domain S-box-containing protein
VIDRPKRLKKRVEHLETLVSESDEARKVVEAVRVRLGGILDAAVDGIATIDEAGTIESINPAMNHLFGYESDELIGENVKVLMPEPYHGEHDVYLANYRATGRGRIIGKGRDVVGLRKDGTTFPIELAVSEGFDGSRRIFTGMVRDITDRREAEETIRESYERLRAIFVSAVDGIIAIDENGIILEVNPAVERIFGYTPDELVGGDVNVLMPAPYRDEHESYLNRYAQTRQKRIIGIGREVRGRRKDGSTFPLYLAVSEGYIEHRRVYTGILRDLGALREVEERARRAEQLAELSTITAGIAHDVGTPMTTILGYAELLQKTVKDRKNKERAGHIVDQVRRVKDLLRTLLDMARPRTASPVELSLADILDHSLGFFREKLKGRGIIVERDYDPVPTVVANRDRLEQVILNLIVNAADAMPDGGILTVRLALASAETVEIQIVDTGIGIEREALDRIFEPFYTTKERGKGTGLGLMVSQRIIHDHGGTINAESEPGVGTAISIRLPYSGRKLHARRRKS